MTMRADIPEFTLLRWYWDRCSPCYHDMELLEAIQGSKYGTDLHAAFDNFIRLATRHPNYLSAANVHKEQCSIAPLLRALQEMSPGNGGINWLARYAAEYLNYVLSPADHDRDEFDADVLEIAKYLVSEKVLSPGKGDAFSQKTIAGWYDPHRIPGWHYGSTVDYALYADDLWGRKF